MKKLGKLSISPEKIMKNEDLINLQGGYVGDNDSCSCYKYNSDERKTESCTCNDPIEDVCGDGWDGYNCM